MRITANSVMRRSTLRKKAIFLDLLSSTAKKWIETETTNRAAEKLISGGPATPEQAEKSIQEAIQAIVAELQESVQESVERIVADNKERIMGELATAEGDAVNNPPMPGVVPPGAPQPPQGAPVIPLQQDSPADEVPMAASRKIHPRLKYAFLGLAQLEPRVDHDTWVIIDGPAGEEAVSGDKVDLNEVEQMIDQLDAGEQVSLSGTSLDKFTSNSDSVFYIDIITGYGATVSQDNDNIPWQVFEEKTDAWDYLNGIASTILKNK